MFAVGGLALGVALAAAGASEGWPDDGEDGLGALDERDRLDLFSDAAGLDRERLVHAFDDPNLPALDISDLERELHAEERRVVDRRRAVGLVLEGRAWASAEPKLFGTVLEEETSAGYAVFLLLRIRPDAFITTLPAISPLLPRDEERRRRRCANLVQPPDEDEETGIAQRLRAARISALDCLDAAGGE
jgi:hypothetical protein